MKVSSEGPKSNSRDSNASESPKKEGQTSGSYGRLSAVEWAAKAKEVCASPLQNKLSRP